MLADFHLDPHFETNFYRSPDVKRILEERTEAVAERARQLAPDDPATEGDDLHSMIEGEVVLEARGFVGRVTSKNFKGGWYEFGTSRQAARPYLRPAAEAEVGPIEGD